MASSTSTTQFGLPFTAPVTQTILPVIIPRQSTAQVVGFFPITSHQFAGTETTYVVQSGQPAAPVTTVTLPTLNSTPGYTPPVSQYMAVVYEWNDTTQDPLITQPWGGYSNFINSTTSGWYSRWSTPTGIQQHAFSWGTLLGSFKVGMGVYPAYVAPTPSTPSPSNGALRWAVTVNLASVEPQCTFFDFNWMDLFNQSLPAAQQVGGTNPVVPFEIVTTSQPSGGAFIATVLQRPEYVPGGATVFDTIRILRMSNTITAGTYTFGFSVTSTTQGVTESASVTLTLTVV
jgi:hypothetical protein